MRQREVFNIFDKECKRMLILLGLKSWDVTIEKDAVPAGREGQVVMDLSGQRAWVDFGKEKLSEAEIKSAARHEILHILLHPIEDRECSVATKLQRLHAIINTLDEFFMKE